MTHVIRVAKMASSISREKIKYDEILRRFDLQPLALNCSEQFSMKKR